MYDIRAYIQVAEEQQRQLELERHKEAQRQKEAQVREAAVAPRHRPKSRPSAAWQDVDSMFACVHVQKYGYVLV